MPMDKKHIMLIYNSIYTLPAQISTFCKSCVVGTCIKSIEMYQELNRKNHLLLNGKAMNISKKILNISSINKMFSLNGGFRWFRHAYDRVYDTLVQQKNVKINKGMCI